MAVVAAYAVPHPPLIIPGCGQGREKGIQATIDAYDTVARRIADIAPETIVVSSPHAPAYHECFAICGQERLQGSFAQWSAADETQDAPIDTEFVHASVDLSERAMLPVMERAWAGQPMDHATFIPLWFVNKYYRDYKLVVCGLSFLADVDHFALGQVFGKVARDLDRKTVFIGSGDLSHKLTMDGPYGFTPEGPLFDQRCCQCFAEGDLKGLFHIDQFIVEGAAECGLRSFMIMAGALDGSSYQSELLSYEGPFGVGYGVASFEVEPR